MGSASQKKERSFRTNFFLRFCGMPLKKFYEIDPADSWMIAAAHNDLPIFVPGWEDSTLGNIFAARYITGEVHDVHTVRSGIEYMIDLADWYRPGQRFFHWFLPNRRWYCGRFPHLRRADAQSRRSCHACSGVGLFLPDQRFHDQFRFLLGRGA